ncbi:MAG TPA: N(G),N(G)-dimethylarginine dimethylaminohydrolase [Kofleriaceae bacterium]|nr:N(G),N(G)-dimethylarginine dimethylaminohydrolase [Kofleriaceae bacterium]
MTVAIVRGVPGSFTRALRAEPVAIDVGRAQEQHAGYVAALRACGAEVVELAADDRLPDCCFVEDTAVVAGGVALITRPGAASRRAEVDAVRAVLAARMPVEEMAAPATLDGGDCLRLGRTLYIGRSARSNAEGIARARAVFAAVGTTVIEVPFAGALHLKSLCSPLGDRAVLAAAGALPPGTFGAAPVIEVPAAEAHAANAACIGDAAVIAAGCPATAALVAAAGYRPVPVDTSELRKADGALTCLSILL